MRGRQTVPRRWLIIAEPADRRGVVLAKALPPRTGLLLLKPAPGREMRQLRRIARQRDLVVVEERPRIAVRVHGAQELKRAMLRRAPIILLSPIFPTQSHPDWKPIPRMRAAASARLGRRRLFALGGMDARRFAQVERLGFIGWAGISAFRT